VKVLRWGLNPRLLRRKVRVPTEQLMRQLSKVRMRKLLLLQPCSINHNYLYNQKILCTGGADGKVVDIGGGVAGSSLT